MNLHRSVLLLVLASVLSAQALSYWRTRELLLVSVSQRETEKVGVLANVVESLVEEYAQGARLAARVLSASRGVRGVLSGARDAPIDSSADEHFRAVLADSNMDVLELIDSVPAVRYRAQPERPGDDWIRAWGVDEALQGSGTQVSHSTANGTAVLSIEPVRDGSKVIGAVLAGRYLGDDFIRGLGRKVGADLALVSRSRVLASSSATALGTVDPRAVEEAFHQKIAVYRDASDGHAKVVYLPLLIVDEAFVMMLRVDSRQAFEALERSFVEALDWTAVVLAASAVLAYLLLHMVLRPLHQLRGRAEKIARELTGVAGAHRGSDEISAVVTVLDSVTERLVQQNRELEQARRDAECASAAKSQFLSNMSHEIRTPLSGMLGMATLLEGTRLDATQRRYCHTITASGRSLFDLLSDILDFSKIEAGKIRLEHIDFDLGALLADVVAIFGEIAATRGCRLAPAIDLPPDAWVRGDPTRLRQVLANLISNAIKFAREGDIVLTVGRPDRAADDGVRWLRFGVRDRGVGFTVEKRDLLFQPFSQADGSTTREYGGSGLGLAISRHLVELMGGSIHAEGAPGEGAYFWFDLPLPQGSAATEATPATEGQVSLLGARVLLAEDHPVNREIIVEMLRGAGADVDAVENGELAVQAVREREYDVVLMDCQMPVMNGYDAARAIRAEERPGGRLPIVAVTANAFAEDRDRCLAAGMDDFMAKPVDQARLRRLVAHWSGIAALAPSATGGLAPNAVGARPVGIVDPARLDEIRALGGEPLLWRMVGQFAVSVDTTLAEVEPATRAGDCASLARAAHFLKGGGLGLGLVDFAASAAELEARAKAGDPGLAAVFRPCVEEALARAMGALERRSGSPGSANP